MELKKYKLSEVATFEISNVDKKTKAGELSVHLCNFTDVYYNWAVTETMEDSFMVATASDNQIVKSDIVYPLRNFLKHGRLSHLPRTCNQYCPKHRREFSHCLLCMTFNICVQPHHLFPAILTFNMIIYEIQLIINI